MPILLKGSCSCGVVDFEVQSHTPAPYQLCYCSICRKQQGGSGYAINLGALFATLKITGKDKIGIYRADIQDNERPVCQRSTGERNFCTQCGSALWLYDPTWPELVHPFASALDSDLPAPKERTHLMLKYKANWAEPEIRPGDKAFDLYPDESIAQWHKRTGMWVK